MMACVLLRRRTWLPGKGDHFRAEEKTALAAWQKNGLRHNRQYKRGGQRRQLFVVRPALGRDAGLLAPLSRPWESRRLIQWATVLSSDACSTGLVR